MWRAAAARFTPGSPRAHSGWRARGSEDATKFYAAEIILAMESVHALGYIHRCDAPRRTPALRPLIARGLEQRPEARQRAAGPGGAREADGHGAVQKG